MSKMVKIRNELTVDVNVVVIREIEQVLTPGAELDIPVDVEERIEIRPTP